jgi:hypothetical protein
MTTTGGTSTFNNVVVTGSLAANGLSLQSDLKLNGNHNPYASLIFGRGATGQSYSSSFVAGGMSNQKLVFGGTLNGGTDSNLSITQSNIAPLQVINSLGASVTGLPITWWIPGQSLANLNSETANGTYLPLPNDSIVIPYLATGTTGPAVMASFNTFIGGPITMYAVSASTSITPVTSQLQPGNYQMVVQDGANNYFLSLEIATNQLYLVPGFNSQNLSTLGNSIYNGLASAMEGSTYQSEVSTYYPNVVIVSSTFTVNATDQLVLFPDASGYIPCFSFIPNYTPSQGTPYSIPINPEVTAEFPYLSPSGIFNDVVAINGSNLMAIGNTSTVQQLASWMLTYPNSYGILTTDSNNVTPGNFGYITTYSYLPPYLLGLVPVFTQGTGASTTYSIGTYSGSSWGPGSVAISATSYAAAIAGATAAAAASSQYPLILGNAAGSAIVTAVGTVASNAVATPFQFVQDYIVQLTSSAAANAASTSYIQPANLPSYLPQSWNGALVEYDPNGYYSYLQYAGMHYWGIFPSGSGTLQYDSNANKFVASLMNDETYTQALQAGTVGKSPNLIANGRLAIEGGAIISNVIANPSSDALVPQFILQNGSEKWRIALITDMGDSNGDGGVMKLAIQRLNTTKLFWETIDDFQSDTQQQNGQAVYTNLLTSQGITETALGSETAYLQAEQAVQPTPFDFTDPIADALIDGTNASDPNIQIQSTSDSSSL